MKTINYDSIEYFENMVAMHKDIVQNIAQWIQEHKSSANKDVVQGVLERQVQEVTK